MLAFRENNMFISHFIEQVIEKGGNMANLTKGQLIEKIAQTEGYSALQAEIAVNTIFDEMSKALQENKRVEVRGFGTFEIREYQSYVGRNPKTGELVNVNEKRAPFFKSGKSLRAILNHPA